jgi:hypothetical protein
VDVASESKVPCAARRLIKMQRGTCSSWQSALAGVKEMIEGASVNPRARATRAWLSVGAFLATAAAALLALVGVKVASAATGVSRASSELLARWAATFSLGGAAVASVAFWRAHGDAWREDREAKRAAEAAARAAAAAANLLSVWVREADGTMTSVLLQRDAPLSRLFVSFCRAKRAGGNAATAAATYAFMRCGERLADMETADSVRLVGGEIIDAEPAPFIFDEDAGDDGDCASADAGAVRKAAPVETLLADARLLLAELQASLRSLGAELAIAESPCASRSAAAITAERRTLASLAAALAAALAPAAAAAAEMACAGAGGAAALSFAVLEHVRFLVEESPVVVRGLARAEIARALPKLTSWGSRQRKAVIKSCDALARVASGSDEGLAECVAAKAPRALARLFRGIAAAASSSRGGGGGGGANEDAGAALAVAAVARCATALCGAREGRKAFNARLHENLPLLRDVMTRMASSSRAVGDCARMLGALARSSGSTWSFRHHHIHELVADLLSSPLTQRSAYAAHGVFEAVAGICGKSDDRPGDREREWLAARVGGLRFAAAPGVLRALVALAAQDAVRASARAAGAAARALREVAQVAADADALVREGAAEQLVALALQPSVEASASAAQRVGAAVEALALGAGGAAALAAAGAGPALAALACAPAVAGNEDAASALASAISAVGEAAE